MDPQSEIVYPEKIEVTQGGIRIWFPNGESTPWIYTSEDVRARCNGDGASIDVMLAAEKLDIRG